MGQLNFQLYGAFAHDVSNRVVFRKLQQKVPEFNKFLIDNPIKAPGLSDKDGSELLGWSTLLDVTSNFFSDVLTQVLDSLAGGRVV